MIPRLAAVVGVFALRVASALLLFKLAASFLAVEGFALLGQLMSFSALLGLLAIGGTQGGVVRQTAAAPDRDGAGRTHAAALLVWLVAMPALLVAALVAGGGISTVLVGSPAEHGVVSLLILLAVAAGPGQIWCSVLSGRERTVASLGAQAAGLLAGVGGAAWFVVHGQWAAAAIAYACGPLLTAAIAAGILKPRLHLRLGRDAAFEARRLLRYSMAVAAASASYAVTMFALRSAYREAFGTVALGHWMAASRISDMSTQLLGLFMVQAFIPRLARMDSEAERRRFILRCGLAGTAVMTLPLIVFSLWPEQLVRLLLSDGFLPAIPAIRTYMAGDILRVWVSLAAFTAFATGSPGRCAAVEIGALAVMALTTSALIAMGNSDAPPWGYLISCAAVATATLTTLLWREYQDRTASVTAETA